MLLSLGGGLLIKAHRSRGEAARQMGVDFFLSIEKEKIFIILRTEKKFFEWLQELPVIFEA